MATNVSSSLPLCFPGSDETYSVTEAISVAINIASLLVNGLHIYILIRMLKRSEDSKYPLLLINLSLADMIFALTLVISLLNEENLYRYRTLVTNRVGVYVEMTLTVSGGAVRYILLSISFIDRYFALCHPFRYDSSIIKRYSHLWMIGGWMLTVLLAVIYEILANGNIFVGKIMIKARAKNVDAILYAMLFPSL